MPYCSNCGNVVDSNFCANCGSQVGGSSVKGSSPPLPEGSNILTPNTLPGRHMAMTYRKNFPQRNFFLWIVISMAILPLVFIVGLISFFLIPLVTLVSGIVYGVYTYYVMVDFTKYVEDMKEKGKLDNVNESSFKPAWLFTLLIIIPYGVQSFSLILTIAFLIFSPNSTFGVVLFGIIFIASPLLYCALGMTFLYLKHKMMEDISYQIVNQSIIRTPINVRDFKRPLTSVGVLYACLFIYILLLFVIPEIGSDASLDNFASLITLYLFILPLLLIALFIVWTYYEFQWHSSLYQLIRDSYMTGVLGDDDMSKGIIRGAQEFS